MIRNLIFTLLIFGCILSHAQVNKTSIIEGQCVSNLEAGVACAHPEAVRIGAEILAKGGNAVDAAIAMEWALAVCYPQAGNLGGGGFMVLRLADGSSTTLDFREMAPAAASATMYQDSAGNIIEGRSLDTHLASGVPGSVRGIFDTHAKFGKLAMEDLIEPAIELAADGFEITQKQARLLNQYRNAFKERNRFQTPFQKDEGRWIPGEKIAQPDLAKTLRRISKNGEEEFYQGETARLIVAEMESGGGILTLEDLKNYQTHWREPIYSEIDSYRIISMPPPSSGGIALAQLFGLWELFGDTAMVHNSPEYIHLLTEMERRVYADRSAHLGDAEFYDVPQRGLISKKYLRQRMSGFDPAKATPSHKIAPGKPAQSESMETTHLSVVDDAGNAVSITTTLNGHFGCKIMVKGAGFFLNNEMDDFSSKPGTPNMFGLIGGKANAIAPGKRMLSSMTPTIVEKDEQLYLVLGSPGGSTIITSVFQTIMNSIVFGMDLSEAIAAPKFHSQWLPDVIYLEEGRFTNKTIDTLKSLGHEIEYFPSLGRVDAITVNPDGSLNACGDMRGDDSAAGIK